MLAVIFQNIKSHNQGNNSCLLLTNLKFREVKYLPRLTVFDLESESQVQYAFYCVTLFLPFTPLSTIHDTNYFYRALSSFKRLYPSFRVVILNSLFIRSEDFLICHTGSKNS